MKKIFEKIKKNFRIIFAVCLMCVVLLIWYAVFYFESRQNLLVTFFDIGQGDAIFIEAQNGNQVLIDGGPGNSILSKLGRRMPFWDRTINLLILTHPHADHLDGLLEVLKRYNVNIVIESSVSHSIPEYQEWQDLLEKKSVKVVAPRAGQRIDIGRGITLYILSPFDDFSEKSVKNVHDATVISRLEQEGSSILFMGDAEKQLEHRLLFEFGEIPAPSGRGSPNFLGRLDSDILKVGHHGSKTSTSEEFLQAVSPQYAIISSGRKNKYGHPHQEVIDRLIKIGSKILRTDQDGDIEFVNSGAGFEQVGW